jgi:hypothetical protein
MGKTVLCIAIPFLVLVAAASQVSAQLALGCDSPDTASQLGSVLVWPGSAAETARMRQAPHGAMRVGKHTLLVHWAGGVHTFRDKPPYDESLAGVQWTYCGFSAKLNMHLVKKNDEAVFKGVLIDEKSGLILPGGATVVFSPDLHSYIAYEQQDGAELADIKLFDHRGTLLWKGNNGLLSGDGQTVAAEFDDVHWDSSGRLIAEYRDSDKRKVVATLTQATNGRWNWISKNQR